MSNGTLAKPFIEMNVAACQKKLLAEGIKIPRNTRKAETVRVARKAFRAERIRQVYQDQSNRITPRQARRIRKAVRRSWGMTGRA